MTAMVRASRSFSRALLAVCMSVTLSVGVASTADAAGATAAKHRHHAKHHVHKPKPKPKPKHKKHARVVKHAKKKAKKKPVRKVVIPPEPVPVRPAVLPAPWTRSHDIGVASFNVNVNLSVAQATADIGKLVANPDIDVIGLQEGRRRPSVYTHIPGWTAFAPTNALEDVVLWRNSSMAYSSSSTYWMCPAVGSQPARWATVVKLTDLATGHDISVVDTHSDTGIEQSGQAVPGSPYVPAALTQFRTLHTLVGSLAGSVVGMGDFNIDWDADHAIQDPHLWAANMEDLVEMNWGRFGTDGYRATQGISDALSTASPYAVPRHIDGVWLKRSSRGVLDFVSQQVITDLYSDHNAVLTRMTVDLDGTGTPGTGTPGA